MSSDEEMIIRGRMMTEFAEAKKRYILLQDESARIGTFVETVGKSMRQPNAVYPIVLTDEHWAALDVDKIKNLQSDIQGTATRLETLRVQLTELGLLG